MHSSNIAATRDQAGDVYYFLPTYAPPTVHGAITTVDSDDNLCFIPTWPQYVKTKIMALIKLSRLCRKMHGILIETFICHAFACREAGKFHVPSSAIRYFPRTYSNFISQPLISIFCPVILNPIKFFFKYYQLF